MNMMKILGVALATALTLTGCGGGGGSAASGSTTTSISGSAVAGAVTGTVTVKDSGGNVVATGNVTNGVFSVPLPNSALAGELDFEVTGTYTDEVSGNAVTLTAANPLALRAAAGHFNAANTNAPITVGSSIIREMVSNNGMTLAAATTAFNTAFGFTPDMAAKPFAPTAAIPAGATQADKDAAFRAGLFSQFGSDLGLTAADLAQLPAKLASDLADGTMDGVGGGNPVTFAGSGADLQKLNATRSLASRLQTATSSFAGNTAANVAGVTAPATYPTVAYDAPGTTKRVTLSDGVTQIDVTLSTLATPPFMNGFKTAHTVHQVNLTNVATGLPIDITAPGAPITAVNQAPKMWMFSGHNHGTPIGASTNPSGAAAGNYDMDTYYIMATAMMGGAPMGLWDYAVQLTEAGGATTTVVFHPNVSMPMGGDLLYGAGSSTTDQWTSKLGTGPREYRVWLDSIAVNGGGGHNMNVFVSTKDMFMSKMQMVMAFPPVATGTTLNGPAVNMVRTPFNLANVTVEASTDNGVSWQPLTSVGGGIYTINGMTGLTSAVKNTIQIRLMVDIGDGNGLVARVDAGGNNPALTFTAP